MKRGVGSTSMTTGGYESMSSLNNDDLIEEEDYDAEVSSLSSEEDDDRRRENEKNETKTEIRATMPRCNSIRQTNAS